MTPSEIKPGMKFGHWEVIKFDHINEHRIKYFLCKCDVCGTIRPVRATALIGGTSTACSKSCSMSPAIGAEYGNWTVLRRDPNNSRNFICKCKCGVERSVKGNNLKTGTSKSCGCLSRQNSKEKNKRNAESHIGERYGKLVIKGYELRNRDYWYLCDCDCGNEKWVSGKHLFYGDINSCGCINSKANTLMDKILTKYKIPFKREYRFEECRDSYPLPFDFALFNDANELIGLIENNGSQHYSARGTQWNTPEKLKYTQKHDRIKQLFAENNDIPLLIIPYQYFNDLEKFLTTSDFWQIIIKNFND